jgi:hypothetical protein
MQRYIDYDSYLIHTHTHTWQRLHRMQLSAYSCMLTCIHISIKHVRVLKSGIPSSQSMFKWQYYARRYKHTCIHTCMWIHPCKVSIHISKHNIYVYIHLRTQKWTYIHGCEYTHAKFPFISPSTIYIYIYIHTHRHRNEHTYIHA